MWNFPLFIEQNLESILNWKTTASTGVYEWEFEFEFDLHNLFSDLPVVLLQQVSMDENLKLTLHNLFSDLPVGTRLISWIYISPELIYVYGVWKDRNFVDIEVEDN